MIERETNRWHGIVAVAFISAGIGIILSRPGLLLASIVGLAYSTYASTTTAPSVSLSINRRISTDSPQPGEEVEVSLEITNTGPTLTDLRVIDGVPSRLRVTANSPRLGTALRTGKSAEFTYTITARRGEHEFTPVTILARDQSGAIEIETTYEEPTKITCIPSLTPMPISFPLRAKTVHFAGSVESKSAGAGVEFHATRDYRPGDPIGRIDWNRLAKTGDLTTIEYIERHRATVVLLIDSRRSAYVGGENHAVDRNVEAAYSVFSTLIQDGHRVGLSALNPIPFWLPPNTGDNHASTVRQELASNPSFSPHPTDQQIVATLQIKELLKRIPANAQIIFFSPMTDDNVQVATARLDSSGHRVTVVSPNVTNTKTPGQRLARVERILRLESLHQQGIPVINWEPDETLSDIILGHTQLEG